MLRKDRTDGKGGGIILYVRKSIKIKNVCFNERVELLDLVFSIDKVDFGLIAGYRPPKPENIVEFMSTLDTRVNILDPVVKDIFIMGDLNLNLFEKENNPLNNFMESHGFNNVVQKGTRLNKATNVYTLLDVILVYSLNSFIASESFDSPISDHNIIVAIFNLKKTKINHVLKHRRCFNDKNIALLKSALLMILSNFFFSLLDVDFFWNTIKNTIISCFDTHIPLKKLNFKTKKKLPWIDMRIISLGKKRDRHFRKAVRTGKFVGNPDWNKYQEFRNKHKSLMFKNRTKYYTSFTSSNSPSSPLLWNKINPFINPNKKPKLQPELFMNNEINTEMETANMFVNFFSSILDKFTFLDLSNCIWYSDNSFKSNNMLASILKNNNKFYFPDFNEKEVLEELLKVDPYSSPGAVNIEAKIFSLCAVELSPILTKLFNLCLKTKKIPDEWKIAHITPLYKGKGSKSDLNNYRPISTLPPIAKVFEKLLARKISKYFEDSDFLTENQYGFRSKSSCELALNTIIQDWRDSLDNNNHTISLFLDLSKAFDTINHKLLLNKLHLYNFDISAIALLENYLSNRFISVKINGINSKNEQLSTGVPQGSVLGPLLFIIFINDMALLPLSSKIAMFADDTTIYSNNLDINKLLDDLVKDLSLISEWLEHNQLILNLNKTVAIHFSFNQRNKSLYKTLHLKFNDEQVKFVDNAKLLGVTIDHLLKFDVHTTNVCKKINSKSYLLSKSIYLFTDKLRPIIFNLFLLSHFDYCGSLFIHLNMKSDEVKLERCFAKAVKRILGVNISNLRNDVQLGLLSRFNILPLGYRRFIQFCSFLYFIFFTNNKLCNSLKKRLNRNDRVYDSRRSWALPVFQTDFKKYSFITISSKLMNYFKRLDIKNSSKKIFLNNVKKNIITYHNECSNFWTKIFIFKINFYL